MKHRIVLSKISMKQNILIICLSLLSVFCGLILIIASKDILALIIQKNLILEPNTSSFERWRHLEKPLSMDIYLFNWTNPQEIYNHSVKPKIQEIGPYRFIFDLTRTNVVWNENGTVTYKMKKEWFNDPVGNTGDLQANVTILNIPALGAVHATRFSNYFVRKGISITLGSLYSTIYLTRTVDEMLFKGFDDPLTKMANTLPMWSGSNLPKMDKFGLFYTKNGSEDFEGIYNMGSGLNSIFGKVYNWNFNPDLPFFEGNCSKIEASSGDNYNPYSLKETIKLFTAELCRPLIFEYVGNTDVDGIEGKKYILSQRTLDNGTKYPENECYCPGECYPSGVFNTSGCNFGAPVFPSLPHFYEADPYYNSQVEGLQPDMDKHQFVIIVEPNTGIPLQVNARLQVNFLLHPVPSISKYEDVPKIFFPVMWTDQQTKLPEDITQMLKICLKIPLGCSIIGTLAVVIGLIFIYRFVRRKKVIKTQIEEEDVFLKDTPKS